MRAMGVLLCGVLMSGVTVARAGEAPAPKADGVIVHSVYFWLADTATDKDVAALVRDCREMLGGMKCVQRVEAGTPLGVTRGAVDGSYHVAVVVYFANKAAYDTYLPHPTHQALVKKHKPLWKKVLVYDILTR